jgi:hypothetical protein
MFVDVSAAGDLGYTYGRYELTFKDATEKGYYARLWARDRGGPWKVVLEVTSPVPAEQ